MTAAPKPQIHTPEDPSGRIAVPVIAEEIEIDAIREESGIVRIRKIVHEDQSAVDASGFREQVKTVRIPVGKVVDKTWGVEQRGTTLVVPVYEERWVRQVILVEELHITKLREVSRQSQTVPVRREEVVVERFDPATSQWRSDTEDSSSG